MECSLLGAFISYFWKFYVWISKLMCTNNVQQSRLKSCTELNWSNAVFRCDTISNKNQYRSLFRNVSISFFSRLLVGICNFTTYKMLTINISIITRAQSSCFIWFFCYYYFVKMNVYVYKWPMVAVGQNEKKIQTKRITKTVSGGQSNQIKWDIKKTVYRFVGINWKKVETSDCSATHKKCLQSIRYCIFGWMHSFEWKVF